MFCVVQYVFPAKSSELCIIKLCFNQNCGKLCVKAVVYCMFKSLHWQNNFFYNELTIQQWIYQWSIMAIAEAINQSNRSIFKVTVMQFPFLCLAVNIFSHVFLQSPLVTKFCSEKYMSLSLEKASLNWWKLRSLVRTFSNIHWNLKHTPTCGTEDIVFLWPKSGHLPSYDHGEGRGIVTAQA